LIYLTFQIKNIPHGKRNYKNACNLWSIWRSRGKK
jgi:hypothetical protein